MRYQLARCALVSPASTVYRPSIQRRVARHTRLQSTGAKNEELTTSSLNPRWLSDLKERIGKCIMFGMTTAQTQEACSVLQEIAVDWRGLVAGSEGFLTEEGRRGLYRQEVVWGEMVRPHSLPMLRA